MPGLALAAHHVEIDLDGEHVLLPRRLVQHGRGRIDDAGLAHAARAQTVHVEDVALELRRSRPRDGKLRVAVGGAGQDRVQQHLDALRLVSCRVVSGNQMS